jgi:hypothetical protein
MPLVMRADDEERHRRNMEHARWRVSFLRCLLDSHRMLPKSKLGWRQAEADYSARLAAAQAEVARLEKL